MTEDRVTSVFDRVAALLEEVPVAAWSAGDRGLLSHMIGQYLENTAAASTEAPDDAEGHAPQRPEGVVDSCARRARLHKNLTRGRTALRALVPYGSIAERVTVPPQSPQFDPNVPAYDIDAFLFDDDDLDALVDAGTVNRHFCARCGNSDHVQMTQFLSHSFNMEQLVYLAEQLLPFAFKKRLDAAPTAPSSFTVVDVGSRLGIVVATAAWSLTKPCRDAGIALQCLGVEMNGKYCDVQRRFFDKMALREPTVAVVEGDATAAGTAANDALRRADVVVMNNVFEWFMPFEEQLDTWKRVRASVSRKGQMLLVVPPLVPTLEPLFAIAAKSESAEPAKKGHRAEQSAAVKAAEAFVDAWVEKLPQESLLEAFYASRAVDGGDEHESEGDQEHLAELLNMMALYVVK